MMVYEKPIAEVISLAPAEKMMDNWGSIEMDEDWEL